MTTALISNRVNMVNKSKICYIIFNIFTSVTPGSLLGNAPTQLHGVLFPARPRPLIPRWNEVRKASIIHADRLQPNPHYLKFWYAYSYRGQIRMARRGAWRKPFPSFIKTTQCVDDSFSHALSLLALICPLCQAQMLDIQIRLRLFLFRLQQVGAHDRLTISCYGFSLYSLFLKTLLHTHTQHANLCFDWEGYKHCHWALGWRRGIQIDTHYSSNVLKGFLVFGRKRETSRVLKHRATVQQWVIFYV